MDPQHVLLLLKERDKRIEDLENEIRSLKNSLYSTLFVKNNTSNISSQDLAQQTTLLDELDKIILSLEKSMDGSKISKLEFENKYFLETLNDYKKQFEEAEKEKKRLEKYIEKQHTHKKKIATVMLSKPQAFNTIFLPNVIANAKRYLESVKSSTNIQIHHEPNNNLTFEDAVNTISDVAVHTNITNIQKIERKRMIEHSDEIITPLVGYLPQPLKRQNARIKE